MRLDIEGFRLIKPVDAVDYYEAGNPISTVSNVQIGEIHQENIKKLLREKGVMTNNQIAAALKITRTTVSGITKRMADNGQIKKGPLVTNTIHKNSHSFYVAS